MIGEGVCWPDEADEVIRGDMTAAVAYTTPAGGAVVVAVASCGIGQRDRGMVGFTTSLGFGKKLERIIRDPHVALAYHARDHGFSASPRFVLAQGLASVDITPSRERLEALVPQVQRYLGEIKRGPVWDRLLREYYSERVFVDIAVERVVSWPDLGCSGGPRVAGAGWPAPPGPQQPPRNGTGPRVDVAQAAGRIGMLAHRVLAYRGGDGFPVVVPVQLAGTTPPGCGWSPRRGSCRLAGAGRGCWRMPTGRGSSGSAPGSSPAGWRSPPTAPPCTRRIPAGVSSRRRARTCC